jgi:hypothetical protein
MNFKSYRSKVVPVSGMVEENSYWSEIRLRDAAKSLDVLICSKDKMPTPVSSCQSWTAELAEVEFRGTVDPSSSAKIMNRSHWAGGCCHLRVKKSSNIG